MLLHAIASLLFAAFATAVLIAGIENRRRAPAYIGIFLAMWGASAWLAPGEPGLVAVYWIPLILIAVLLATMVALLAGERRKSDAEERRETAAGLATFFGLIVIVLVGAIAWSSTH